MGATIRNAVQLALGGFLTLATRDGESPPMAPALEGAYQLGRGEARNGRTMEALLAAYRIGARVSWRDMSRTAVDERHRRRPAVAVRRARLRLHRRALRGQRGRPHRRAGEHRPAAAAQPRTPRPGADHRGRAGGRRGRGGARQLGPAGRADRRTAARVAGGARLDAGRRRHPATRRGPAGRPRRVAPCCWCRRPAPPSARTGLLRALRGTSAVVGPSVPWLDAARSHERAGRAFALEPARTSSTPTRTSRRSCWPPTPTPAPTCAPRCSRRSPASGPRPSTSSPRHCGPGCSTRAAATPSRPSSSCTRRPCAIASSSCESCTATGWRIRSSCSRRRCALAVSGVRDAAGRVVAEFRRPVGQGEDMRIARLCVDGADRDAPVLCVGPRPRGRRRLHPRLPRRPDRPGLPHGRRRADLRQHWASVGATGVQPYTDVTQAYFNSLPPYPADGAIANDGVQTYRWAGGAPIVVTNWANVDGEKPSIRIDPEAIAEAGTARWSRLRQQPLDGTLDRRPTPRGPGERGRVRDRRWSAGLRRDLGRHRWHAPLHGGRHGGDPERRQRRGATTTTSTIDRPRARPIHAGTSCYVITGGAPIPNGTGACGTRVDPQAIANAGQPGKWSHLKARRHRHRRPRHRRLRHRP